jgi:hypothetical protein
MNRSSSRFATGRWFHVGWAVAVCIGVGSSFARAAVPEEGIGTRTPSTFTLEVINDTRSQIVSFSIAPAGTGHWTRIDFNRPMQPSSFDVGFAVSLRVRDDDGCLRDLRTVLSDGRRIVTRHFDLCHVHAYWPGMRIL